MKVLKNFKIDFKHHTLIGDIIGDEAISNLLILHGAGNGTRDRFLELRNSLSDANHTSLAFDFIGHGETGGELADSGLKLRTEQALTVLEKISYTIPLAVLGSSMGAYNAVKLTEHLDISTLILFVPGMYTPEAYSVNFGPDFSKIIRLNRSWEDTDAWEILESFEGKLLVVAAENDKIIPKEIPEKLYASATRANSRELYVVPNAPHLLIHYLNKNPELFKTLSDKLLNTLKTSI